MNFLSNLITVFTMLTLLPSISNAIEINGVGLQTSLSKAVEMLENNCQKVEHHRNSSKYEGKNCSTNITDYADAYIAIHYNGRIFREVSAFNVWALAGHKRQPYDLLNYFRGNTRSYRLRSEWSCEKMELGDGYSSTLCEEVFYADGGKSSGYKNIYYQIGFQSYKSGNVFSLDGQIN